MTLPTFKIHCSAIGEIMGGAFNKPTELQMNQLAELEAKEKRTDKQEQTLQDLIAKRDAPPALQDGAKTYCQNWLKQQLYKRRKEFSNKYTEKGNICEPAAIDFVAKKMGYGLVIKNEQYYENDFMCGTPDLVLPEIIEEIKNSWSVWTFPLFSNEIPDKQYPLQVQGYMALTGIRKAAVNYCLIDAPLEIMDREARSVWYKAGNSGDVDMECYDEVYAKMTYADIPDELKWKRFEFNYSQPIIDAIERQVMLCRSYIDTLINPMQMEHTYDLQAMKEAKISQ